MDNYEFSGKSVEDAITAACVELGVTSDQITYEVIDQGSKGFFNLGSKDAVIRLTTLRGEKVGTAAETEAEKTSDEAPSGNEQASAPVEKAAAFFSDSSNKIPDDLSSEKKETASASQNADEDIEQKKSRRERESFGPSDPAVVGIAEQFLKDVFHAMNIEVKLDSKLDAEDNLLSIDISGNDMGVIIGKRGQTLDSLQYITSLAVNRKTSPYTRVKLDTEDYRERRKKTLENLAKNVAGKVKRTHRSVSLESMNPYERRIIHYALQDDPYVTTHSEGEEPYRHVVVDPKKDKGYDYD